MLKAAFEGPFIEGTTRSYCLNDVDPNTFRLLIKWIYTQKILLRPDKYFQKQMGKEAATASADVVGPQEKAGETEDEDEDQTGNDVCDDCSKDW